MGARTLHYCDICQKQIGPGSDVIEQYSIWQGHIKYRISTTDGLKGEKIDLCSTHAQEVYNFIKDLKVRK